MKSLKSKKIILLVIPAVILAVIFVFILADRAQKTKLNNPSENTAQASQNELPTVNDQKNSEETTEIPKETPTKIDGERPTISPLNHEIVQGNTQNKKIALTLDAGASATQTPQILTILKENNVKCTFFVTGKWAQSNPELIKQIVADGHTLGNHTYSHTDLTTLSDSQILEEFEKTEKIIQSIVPGTTTKPYFRAPYGARNQHILDVAASAGYQEIYWTFDALDWKTESTASFVENRIYTNVQNGAIILMHVGDDITPTILDRVIHHLKTEGFIPTTLDNVLAS